MVRYINLTDYIPEFMKDFRELTYLLEAETIEFRKLLAETYRALDNQFIEHCDIDGIEKFEKMVELTPEENDDLKTRIARVLMKWNSELPYTLNGIKSKLQSICGDDYLIVPQYEKYTLKLIVSLPLKNQVEDLKEYLHTVLPANMDYFIENILNKTTNGTEYFAGNLVTTLIRRTIETEVEGA